MDDQAACKHADISGCDATCACTCAECQVRFEIEWAKRAIAENLCSLCGVPRDLTPETLLRGRHTHFFQPGPDCVEPFDACMKLAKLCQVCYTYVDEDICRECEKRELTQRSSRASR
jgi:hypothetical protein